MLALVGAALLLLSASASLAAAFAAFFLLRLLCQGAIGVGTLTAVARWFQASRGRALALVGAGYTLGELTMPGAMTALQTALGWRGSLILLGLVYLLVAAPVVLWLLPEPRPSSGTSDTRAPGSHPKVGITLGAAARSRTFWLLTASMAVTPLVLTGILLHQPAIFRSLGWSADAVPAALRVYAGASLAAAYAAGWMLDRVPPRWGVVGGLLTLTAAMLVPVWAGAWPGSLWIYAALLGAAAGANSTTNGAVWPEYFGLSALGSIKSVVSAARNAATAVGAAAVVMLGERGGGYALPLTACAAVAFASAVSVALALPDPVRDRHGIDAEAAA